MWRRLGRPALSVRRFRTDGLQALRNLRLFQWRPIAGRHGGRDRIDFNYGGAPDLQLTTVLPLAYDQTGRTGLGNVELAAKYRFAHQEEDGIDLSVFPRVFLPSISRGIGDQHAAFLLPLWAEKDFGKWGIYGGGGCEINRGDDGQNSCLGGMAVTREVAEGVRLGLEVFHQGADSKSGRVATALGGGLTWDLDDNHHLLAYWGPSPQNIDATGRSNAYVAMLFTL